MLDMCTKPVLRGFLLGSLIVGGLAANVPMSRRCAGSSIDHEVNTTAQMQHDSPATIKAEWPSCILVDRTEKFDLSEKANIRYDPDRVRVKRCDGYHRTHLLTCRPRSTRNVTFLVKKYGPGTDSTDVYVNKTEDVECEFQCKVTEQDCNKSQSYHENVCACICNNTEEKRACEEDHELKEWNNETCTCSCRDTDDPDFCL